MAIWDNPQTEAGTDLTLPTRVEYLPVSQHNDLISIQHNLNEWGGVLVEITPSSPEAQKADAKTPPGKPSPTPEWKRTAFMQKLLDEWHKTEAKLPKQPNHQDDKIPVYMK